MGKRILGWFRRDAVLTISLCLAVLSCLIEPPGLGYLNYIDFDTLITLFCLMLLVEGLREEQFLQYAANRVLSQVRTVRGLMVTLVFLCFVSSMLITNDVALITFVPFAIMLLSMANETDLLIPVVVLQTIAANLGSMFTPVGNPQNLYLYSGFSIPIGKFLIIMLPLTVLSFFLLTLAVFLLPNKPLEIRNLERIQPPKKRPLFIYLFLLGFVLDASPISFPIRSCWQSSFWAYGFTTVLFSVRQTTICSLHLYVSLYLSAIWNGFLLFPVFSAL